MKRASDLEARPWGLLLALFVVAACGGNGGSGEPQPVAAQCPCFAVEDITGSDASCWRPAEDSFGTSDVRPSSGVFTEPTVFAATVYAESPNNRCFARDESAVEGVTAEEEQACADAIRSAVPECPEATCPCFDASDLGGEQCAQSIVVRGIDVVRAGPYSVGWDPQSDTFACAPLPQPPPVLNARIPRDAAFACLRALQALPSCNF